jgi:hypothetical protein
VNSPSVLVSIRFFGMGKGMGGDISQRKRLYAAITCSNFERTLPPPRQPFSGISCWFAWLNNSDRITLLRSACGKPLAAQAQSALIRSPSRTARS